MSKKTITLSVALFTLIGLVSSVTTIASAQNYGPEYFSGPVITGPDYCSNQSLGGPVTYPFDSNRDGVADTCSLPQTRRVAAAYQNALERLAEQFPTTFNSFFAGECLRVNETFGELIAEATDECALPRQTLTTGRPLQPVVPATTPNTVFDARFYSGPVITHPSFCLNRSFGGPVTYPFDSNRDGVADTCSLPRTRRAAVARQNALERLTTQQAATFTIFFRNECAIGPATFGETVQEATDTCAAHRGIITRPLPLPSVSPPPTGGGRPSNLPPISTVPRRSTSTAPQIVSLSPGDQQITVVWTPPTSGSAVVEYELQWTPVGQAFSTRPAAFPTAGDTSHTITGLTNLTTYNVQMRAIRSNGPGPWSGLGSTTPGLAAPPDGIQLTNDNYSEIRVSWVPPTTTLTINSYIVQWATSSRGWSTNRQILTPNQQYTIRNLSGNTTYYVRVQSVTSNGPGPWSTANNFTAPGGDNGNSSRQNFLRTGSSAAFTPGRPTNLTLAPGNGTLTASWTAPAAGANNAPTGYLVEWRLQNQGSWVREPLTSTGTTYRINQLRNLTSYQVRVRAINGNAAGSWSSTVVGVPGVAETPQNVSLESRNRWIRVTWDTSSATRYIVQWSTNSRRWSTTDQASDPGTSYDIRRLNNGVTYYVRVQAVNSNGPGAWSTPVSVKVGLPVAPTMVELTAASGSIEVMWGANNRPATSYTVQWRLCTTSCNAWSTTRQYTTASEGVITYDITGLTPAESRWEVRVLATNGFGDGPWSDVETDTLEAASSS